MFIRTDKIVDKAVKDTFKEIELELNRIDIIKLVQGIETSKSILRTMVWHIKPGDTPGSHINVTDLSSSRGYNPLAVNNAVDLAKSASSGDWDLNATGTLLAFSPSENIIGIVSVSIVLHDLNSSSSTEIYYIDADISAGHINFRVSLSGTVVNLDWTTILDAGDTVRLLCSFITSD